MRLDVPDARSELSRDASEARKLLIECRPQLLACHETAAATETLAVGIGRVGTHGHIVRPGFTYRCLDAGTITRVPAAGNVAARHDVQ